MDYSSYFKEYNKTIYELINKVNPNLIEQSGVYARLIKTLLGETELAGLPLR